MHRILPARHVEIGSVVNAAAIVVVYSLMATLSTAKLLLAIKNLTHKRQ